MSSAIQTGCSQTSFRSRTWCGLVSLEMGNIWFQSEMFCIELLSKYEFQNSLALKYIPRQINGRISSTYKGVSGFQVHPLKWTQFIKAHLLIWTEALLQIGSSQTLTFLKPSRTSFIFSYLLMRSASDFSTEFKSANACSFSIISCCTVWCDIDFSFCSSSVENNYIKVSGKNNNDYFVISTSVHLLILQNQNFCLRKKAYLNSTTVSKPDITFSNLRNIRIYGNSKCSKSLTAHHF